MFQYFREVFASVLVELMQRYHQPVDPNNLHAILLKDAVYNAVGLVAFELYDEVGTNYYNNYCKQSVIQLSHFYVLGQF